MAKKSQVSLDELIKLSHIQFVKKEQEYNLAQSRAKVFKALGHPSRMLMVTHLASKKASVGELAEVVGSDLSTVSKHLTVLKNVGILTDRKDANRVLYTLICPCILEFIHCIDDVIFQDASKGLSCVLPGAKITGGGPSDKSSVSFVGMRETRHVD